MTKRKHPHVASGIRTLLAAVVVFTTGMIITASSEDSELSHLYRSRIPKTEIGVTTFLESYPEFDGRDVVIAVFDTGVDPGAPGLQVTSTGERKIVDIIDASGAGDVDTTTIVKADKQGILTGLTGRKLQLPSDIKNPAGVFHIGVKYGLELFHEEVWDRITEWRSSRMKALIQEADSKRLLQKKLDVGSEDKEVTSDPRKVLDETVKETELEKFERQLQEDDPGPYYDCVVWNDGDDWRVIVDTDEDGDLRDEQQLRAFRTAGEYASFPDYVAMNFGVAVYQDGNLLSIVTTSGSHGTHVASIASANYPEQPDLNGIAPGAKILSIRIGDTRINGSSVYTGENRATAIAAQYKVDVMNASWGGQSIYQNASTWGCELYNTLVEKYNVTAFVSAGNDGPALSSMGTPGGEASSVIGVGAYVSPEMGKLLYSAVDETPETMFMFSARGPARNGDLGVDVVAPGAAIATLAFDSVQGSDLYNGTSMSSPSAAGVGALLISAAKQSGLHYSPARIRYALMNSAKFLDTESPFSQGAGLIQASAAWEHLKSYQAVSELDVYYSIRTHGSRYSDGPGLYLRGDLPSGVRSYRVNLDPRFADAFTNRDQYEFGADFSITADKDWIKVPEVVHLSNAGNYILPEIDFSKLTDAVAPQLATIAFTLSNHPDAGPLMRIPVTVVSGGPAVGENNTFPEIKLEIDASRTFRKFITVPSRATHLSLTLQRESDDDIEKLYVISAMTLVANEDIETYELHQYFRLGSGNSVDFEIPALPNELMELSIHQAWAYDQPTSFSCKGKWRGVTVDQQGLSFDGGALTPELSIRSIGDESYTVSAELNRAVYSYFPNKTEIYPGDSRGLFPAGREESTGTQSFWLTQEYDIELAADQDLWFQPNEYYTEFRSGGGIYEVYNEKGLLIATGTASMDEESIIHLPKGKLKIVREFTAQHPSTLKMIEKESITLIAKIDPISLDTYVGHKSLINKAATSDFNLMKDRESSLFVAPPSKNPYEDLDGEPDFLTGLATISVDDIDLEEVPLVYVNGEFYQEPEKETTASVESTQEGENPYQKYLDTVYKQQLAFLKETRGSTNVDVVEKHQTMLQSLLKSGKNDPELWLEDIYGYAIQNNLLHPWITDSKNSGDEKSSKKPDALLKKIQTMIDGLEPAKVAQYLGMPPYVDLPDSPEARRIEKETASYTQTRQYIAEANLLAADANLFAGRLEQTRQMLNEAKRWQPKKDLAPKLQKLEILLLKQEGYYALALETLGKAIEENPTDPMLLDWKKELYQALGWNEFKTYDDLLDNLSKNASKLR